MILDGLSCSRLFEYADDFLAIFELPIISLSLLHRFFVLRELLVGVLMLVLYLLMYILQKLIASILLGLVHQALLQQAVVPELLRQPSLILSSVVRSCLRFSSCVRWGRRFLHEVLPKCLRLV